MLDGIEEVEEVRRLVIPADGEVIGLQHLAELVAHQLDDRLEVHPTGDALLHAVDDRQLGDALRMVRPQTFVIRHQFVELEHRAPVVSAIVSPLCGARYNSRSRLVTADPRCFESASNGTPLRCVRAREPPSAHRVLAR